uniref:Small ribosomal subunit protein uS4c n=1 Tax=Staurastrum punctulatum TaxID=102822 RepID=RR4_STAPU|nr:ribosomal protein S4 [Staurastrum punctulatum]Q32RY4.1 RecName: Full=Small ribosomal subunit protein uS4c; AltName: Full=30S ribosomal protein S4, chloroplastic [Staurastrum punctulatum]AAX45759.1 ribosomal protein S4 [Staurastrum punctulatum]
MSRYRGPRLKIIRRLNTPLPGLTSSPIVNSTVNTKSQRKDKSEYRIRLEEKQKLRFHYGITERQLLRYVRLARRAKGSTGQVLLQLLEMRLDNIIFRLGMAPTIPAARQLVNHGHVLVNERVVDIPSFRCKPQENISIRDRARSRALVDKNLNNSQESKKLSPSRDFLSKVPTHLRINTKNYKASVNQVVNRNSIGVKVNELLVVEYYSRQA